MSLFVQSMTYSKFQWCVELEGQELVGTGSYSFIVIDLIIENKILQTLLQFIWRHLVIKIPWFSILFYLGQHFSTRGKLKKWVDEFSKLYTVHYLLLRSVVCFELRIYTSWLYCNIQVASLLKKDIVFQIRLTFFKLETMLQVVSR